MDAGPASAPSQAPPPPPGGEGLGGRVASIVVTVAIAIAVTGFLSGASEREMRRPAPLRPAPALTAAPPAPAYGDARGPRALGVNGGHVSRLETLRAPGAPVPASAGGAASPGAGGTASATAGGTVSPGAGGAASAPAPSLAKATPEERDAAIGARARRRAYDGAPPVIPHPAPPQQVEVCLACHGDGLVVDGLLAPRISHPRYLSCTQCHVAREGGAAYLTAALAAAPEGSMSAFAGMDRPGPGARASEIAPPVIPHATRMREDCASCHGPLGLPGLRTSHPERVSCLQCHATQAPLDQRAPPPLPREAPRVEAVEPAADARPGW